MCFHPKLNVTLPLMKQEEIEDVIETWMKEVESLQSKYTWVQVFENKGEIMGCSNPHPHSQIWASSFLPNEPRIEDSNQRNYFQQHSSPLLLDYAKREAEIHESEQEMSRVVVQNQHWLVVVSDTTSNGMRFQNKPSSVQTFFLTGSFLGYLAL